MEDEEGFLREAIRLAAESARSGGGPFGAVIVHNGNILARGTNQVTATPDPTAHAEIVAIRAACQARSDFRLGGCVLFTSCEPCPMCLAASYWARLDKIVFAASQTDASGAGFDDGFLYRELVLPTGKRKLPSIQRLRAEGQKPFQEWQANEGRIEY